MMRDPLVAFVASESIGRKITGRASTTQEEKYLLIAPYISMMYILIRLECIIILCSSWINIQAAAAAANNKKLDETLWWWLTEELN